MSVLDDLAADVLRADQQRPRSLQLEPGASSTYSCRAAVVLRATGHPESDPHLSWPAVVGTAVHSLIETARKADGRVAEQRLTYRGVPCTVDEIDGRTVRDWKTKADAAAIAAVRRDGPRQGQVAQVMLAAAAAIEAGHDITTVELVFVPRSGDLRDGWVWSAPFDRQVADEAADWHEQVGKLVSERTGLDPDAVVDGLRDSPPSWCYAYCPFVTACRGEPSPAPEVDDGVRDVAAEYLDAAALKDEAEARMKAARTFIEPFTDLRAVGLQWSGGNERTVQEVDLDAVRFILGDLPMVTVEKVTARSLRRLK